MGRLKELIQRERLLPLSLLIIFIITFVALPKGIVTTLVGDSYIQPWKVLIVFFASAYVAISADVSHLFKYLTERLFNRQLPSRMAVFVGVFLFSGFLTLLASNDIVVLTLTPIICYLARYQHINVMPLLFAEFLAANSFSMMFYVGDPTNIIIANALGASFTSFASTMFLPTLASVIVLFIALIVHFRHDLHGRTEHKGLSSKIDTPTVNMAISATLLIGMLGSFAAGALLNFEAWQVAMVFATISLAKDIVISLRQKHYMRQVWHALPWKIIGLLIVLFIAVQFATSLYAPSQLLQATNQSLFSMVFGTATIGMLLANIINNQPATLLLTTALREGNTIAAPAAYAIVMATSLGATLSLVGTLAGLMWQRLLNKEEIQMSHRTYMRHSFRIVPYGVLAGLIVLYLQFI